MVVATRYASSAGVSVFSPTAAWVAPWSTRRNFGATSASNSRRMPSCGERRVDVGMGDEHRERHVRQQPQVTGEPAVGLDQGADTRVGKPGSRHGRPHRERTERQTVQTEAPTIDASGELARRLVRSRQDLADDERDVVGLLREIGDTCVEQCGIERRELVVGDGEARHSDHVARLGPVPGEGGELARMAVETMGEHDQRSGVIARWQVHRGRQLTSRRSRAVTDRRCRPCRVDEVELDDADLVHGARR